MSILFIPGQAVKVTKPFGAFQADEEHFVAFNDKLPGQRRCMLKDANGNIKGSIPQDYLIAK